MRILLSFLMTCISPFVYAAVYECANQDGGVEYRDNPCFLAEGQQKQLDLPKDVVSQADRKKHRNKRELELREKDARKIEKRRQKDMKDNMIKRLRKKRHDNRCKAATEELKRIEDVLRQGYRLKRERTLKRKIEEQKAQQQKYCIE